MSNIIETYQEEQAIKQPAVTMFALAKVISVGASGVVVQFDGESVASTKAYRRNTDATFTAGQRVLMLKVNGEYIVLCPVG